MCPPASMPYLWEGMSYLHKSWMYQLQHGPQLQVCFMCFKSAFLKLRELLQLEDWDSEPVEFMEAGPEQWGDLGMGPSWGQGQGQLAEGSSGHGGPGALAPAQVPTELLPQDAVPLALGLEDASWTRGLPWRLEVPPACPLWHSLPPPWQGFLKVEVPPGEPLVLELGCLDPAEAENWLLDLKVIAMVGGFEAIYFRKMAPNKGQGWKLLLEPKELWVVRLQDAPQQQDLYRWKLSILESSSPGQNEEQLVSVDTALLKCVFTILSCSPLANRAPEQTWGSGPGENLAVTGASALGELPCVQ
uniref:2-oxoglutarate and iron dependent oxygenase domain containing 3 n=1 Tax=Loxodonta africana TaxID=9785 RepID=G3UBX2_LOXAF